MQKNEKPMDIAEVLARRKPQLIAKRAMDILLSACALAVLWPLLLLTALAVVIDDPGPVFYRQVRIGRDGKPFRIFKFRSMVENADRGSQVTVSGDARVTRVGRLVRKCRLDEVSQLIDVLRGTMTFVGTRPEVPKYVAAYTDEMRATLLLPAGVTSRASIFYKDEAELLDAAEDPDRTYVEKILPEKMKYNLDSLRHYGFFGDIGTMFATVFAVLGVGGKGKK